jgi:hypothetical protein
MLGPPGGGYSFTPNLEGFGIYGAWLEVSTTSRRPSFEAYGDIRKISHVLEDFGPFERPGMPDAGRLIVE